MKTWIAVLADGRELRPVQAVDYEDATVVIAETFPMIPVEEIYSPDAEILL